MRWHAQSVSNNFCKRCRYIGMCVLYPQSAVVSLITKTGRTNRRRMQWRKRVTVSSCYSAVGPITDNPDGRIYYINNICIYCSLCTGAIAKTSGVGERWWNWNFHSSRNTGFVYYTLLYLNIFFPSRKAISGTIATGNERPTGFYQNSIIAAAAARSIHIRIGIYNII